MSSKPASVRRDAGVPGEGAVWAAAGFAASLILGVALEPFRGRIGLENVVILYLAIVLLCAAIGGRAAGLAAALSAALAYNFFFTTPYRTLVIDTAQQVTTVALLFAAGLLAALAGRSTRRGAVRHQQEADALALLNDVARAAAEGGDADQAAADGLLDLLDARTVQVRRGGRITAEAGAAEGDLNPADMAQLDAYGRLPHGRRLRYLSPGGFALPREGVAVPLGRRGGQPGALVVIPGADRGVSRSVRAGLVALAHTLALAGPLSGGLPAVGGNGHAPG